MIRFHNLGDLGKSFPPVGVRGLRAALSAGTPLG